MSWNKDTDYDVILTDKAEGQSRKILDYILNELNNAQAAYSVERDMKETVMRLSYMASSFKLCDNSKLQALGYRTIHLKHHKYFMLYKIIEKQVYIVGIYHDSQDYENVL